MVSNPGKGIGLHPLQGIEGEVEGGQAGQAAEGLVVDDGDLVVGQVEHDQGLDLIELGVRYGTDTVTVQVQMFQSALNL